MIVHRYIYLVSLFLTTNSFISSPKKFTSKVVLKGYNSRDGKQDDKPVPEGRNFKVDVEGGQIAYDIFTARKVEGPPVYYMPGLNTNKGCGQSSNLQSWCRRNGYTYVASDWFGVGSSSGEFSDGCLTRYTTDTIAVLEKVFGKKNPPKAVLVGHGVGAWVAFLVALKRPDLVRGIVAMGADPDFTEVLLWKKLPEDIKDKIMTEGLCEIKWGLETYPISRKLVLDARDNLLLTGGRGSIKLTCPVRLIHGLRDEEVPFDYALQLADKCASQDVKVMLLKGSTHMMDLPDDMRAMRDMVQDTMDAFIGEFDLTCPGSG